MTHLRETLAFTELVQLCQLGTCVKTLILKDILQLCHV